MVSTITLLIDKEQVLLNEFITMAQGYDEENLSELADDIQQWFEAFVDDDKIELKVNLAAFSVPAQQRRESIGFLFKYMLSSLIQNISCTEWKAIARHYITKAAGAN